MKRWFNQEIKTTKYEIINTSNNNFALNWNEIVFDFMSIADSEPSILKNLELDLSILTHNLFDESISFEYWGKI